MARDIRIFLSSPGDVPEERDLAQRVIEKLNNDAEFREHFHLILYRWDDPNVVLPMSAADTPQQSVNVYMIKPLACDLVVVLFWSRMGTKLVIDGREYLSGTHYEYTEALEGKRANGKPDVWLYHCTRKIAVDLDDPKRDFKSQQYDLVQQFFKGFQDEEDRLKGSISEFTEPDEFGKKFDGQLRTYLRHLTKHPEPAKLALVPKLEGPPYRGLLALKESDAPIFFGRERETLELLAQVERDPFVFVIGASGSGKSSLAAAGVLPRLRARGDWHIIHITPNNDPYYVLALVIALIYPGFGISTSEKITEAERLAESLRSDEMSVDNLLNAVLPNNERILLYIDQFEDLFTQVTKEQRDSFVTNLHNFSSRVTVLATLRADFYEAALTHFEQELRRAFSLGKPSAFALHEMIVRPAELAGYRLDDGLAETIVDEVYDQPGGLPLVAYLLEELYLRAKKRRDWQLTRADYDELGGVRGAIGRRAEEVFTALDAEAQEALPRVFHDLIEVDERGTATRRRAPLNTITSADSARRLVEAFTEARLLIPGKDDARSANIEVAHEALLREWPRMAKWIQQAQEDLYLLRRIRQASHEWDAIGQPEDYPFFWPHELLIQVEVARKRWQVTFDEVTAQFARPEAERLVAYLNSDSNISRNFIYQRLRRIGKAAIPVLIEMLENSDSTIRQNAVEILVFIDSEQALDVLIKMLNDPAVGVRYAAIEALGQIKSEQALNPLAEMLNDPIAKVRGLTIEALERIKSEDAISYLIIALNDSSERVRRKAAAALGTIGSLKGETALIERLTDPAESVRRNAAKSLVEIESTAGIYKLVELLKAASKRDRRIAMEALSTMKSTECVGILELALEDSADLVRQTIIQVLGKIASERAITTIISSMNDPSETVRQACAKALRVTNSVQAIDGLKVLLNDPIELVRQTSVETLEAINTPEALEVLAKWGHR